MNRIFLYSILMFLALCCSKEPYAQVVHKLSIGMTTGYRYDNSSIYAEYAFTPKVQMTAEYVQGKYSGLGFAFGAYYYFYPFTGKQLSIGSGLVFSRTIGLGFSIGSSDQNDSANTFFNVTDVDFLIPTLAFRYDIPAESEPHNGYFRKGALSLFIRIGYRMLVGNAAEVSYISGPPDPHDEKDIQRDVSKGIGFSVGFSIYIGKKRKYKPIG
jgi:hypothetical protein